MGEAFLRLFWLAVLVAGSCRLQPAAAPIAGKSRVVAVVDLAHVRVAVLAPDIWMHTSNDSDGYPANGLIESTSRGLILIDTGWTTSQTEEILTFGERDLGRRWTVAIITHSHRDRSGGLASVTARRIPVIASEDTLRLLGLSGKAGGSAIGAGEEVRDDGFSLYNPGAAHSSDNIVVWFPAQKILFGGCMVKALEAANLGFVGDADLEHWPQAIAALQQRYPDAHLIVPGHGDPGTSSLLSHTQGLLTASNSAAASR